MVIFTEDAGFAEAEQVHLILNTLTGNFLKKKMIDKRLDFLKAVFVCLSFLSLQSIWKRKRKKRTHSNSRTWRIIGR